jgi:predicted DNA-binding mobile mystery protein A
MARSTQTIQREQMRKQIAQAASMARLGRPAPGWIHTVRTALGMSGAALSKRLGGGRTMAANLERYEREERVTLKNMREAAEALGCRLVYAIVPPDGRSIESLVEVQARARAAEMLRDVAVHMSLEGQQLGDEDARAELDRITRELMQHPPRDFWEPDRRDR